MKFICLSLKQVVLEDIVAIEKSISIILHKNLHRDSLVYYHQLYLDAMQGEEKKRWNKGTISTKIMQKQIYTGKF